MVIQAVFWDYDNTILETKEAHWHKHQTVLSRYGIELKDDHRQRVYENNGNQNWEWMQVELGLTVPEQIYLQEVDQEFQSHMIRLQMRTGISQLFTLISNLGIPQAIITNARRDSAEPVLQAKGILSLMKFSLYKEDYSGRKPDPEPYLAGFEKMGALLGTSIQPSRCIAIEDDPKGVEAAKRAGAIVIHRKLSPNDKDSPYADYCCYHEVDFIEIAKNLLKGSIPY